MDNTPTTTDELYRELISTQAEWRDQYTQLIGDYTTAINKLDSARKNFDLFSRVIIGLIVLSLIICVAGLIYTGKIKFCKIEYKDFVIMSDTCPT